LVLPTNAKLESKRGNPEHTAENAAALEKLIGLFKESLKKITDGEHRDYEVPDHDAERYMNKEGRKRPF